MEIPVHRRKFAAFLSHAHADQAVVNGIETWLSDQAGIPVWYDRKHLPASAEIVSELPRAIAKCRGVILVLSEQSTRSGWVEQEYNFAKSQQTEHRDFRIIPIKVDDCEVPRFLKTTRWIELSGNALTLSSACDLMLSLYHEDPNLDISQNRDIYVARTWRDEEAQLADQVCADLIAMDIRLVGDSKDQQGFDNANRVRSIISSCGALVAILPLREGGTTSKYIVEEISIAREVGIPYLAISEPGVQLPDWLSKEVVLQAPGDGASAALAGELGELVDRWSQPPEPHYFFFATDIDDQRAELNKTARRLISQVTAMPCVMGDDIFTGQVQAEIRRGIRKAFAMVADISDDNLNTCIEAGVALGGQVPLHLICRKPRRRPPFMFRDQQVWHYAGELELLGALHKIVQKYRRRILNYQISSRRWV